MGEAQGAAALLALIESQWSARCAELQAQARAEAQALLRRAHREARERVRRALDEAQRRAQRELALAQARARARERLHEQRRQAAQLRAAWQRLPAALQARWQDSAARARWTEALAARARALLPQRAWRVAHPADWSARERERFAQLVAGALESPPQFAADPQIRAGLRIAAGSTVIDATLAGLTSEREALEARLLHHLARATP
jgi:hypothetical protein